MLLALLGARLASVAQADYVTLKSGGEIRGEFFADAKTTSASAAQMAIRTLSGATVIVHRDEVVDVVRRPLIVEEYQTCRRAAPDTLAGHWELADWCRRQALPRERAHHLHKVLEFDGEHILAHRALGHIRDQGNWTTRDEMLAARGYVKHKGKHLLPQELQLNDQQERTREAERTWVKRIKQWQVWLGGENSTRKSAAVARLNDIHDPAAIPALVRWFRNAPDEEHRLLFVRILTDIEGEKSLAALVTQSLVDESPKVRDAAITGVRRKDAARAIPMYLRFLKNELNPVVNRAGSALGQLADDRVIPYLIEALRTRHKYRALARDNASEITTSETQDLIAVLGPSSETNTAIGKLPARDSEPATFGPNDEEFEIHVAKVEENPAVLAALTLLTGRHFGYDVDAWRTWLNARNNRAGKKTP
jgi:hypothetical protein